MIPSSPQFPPGVRWELRKERMDGTRWHGMADFLVLLSRGFLGGVLGSSVNMQNVAGGRLAEMRTAGVALNTREMGAGIGGPEKKAQGP